MKPHLFALPVLAFVTACGPSAADYPSGPASAQESITDCNRGGSRSTPLIEADEASINEGTDSDLELAIAGCTFKGTLLETTGFEIPRQSCAFPSTTPAISIRVSGTGQLDGADVFVALSGEYATLDDFGYQVNCAYEAEIVIHGVEE